MEIINSNLKKEDIQQFLPNLSNLKILNYFKNPVCDIKNNYDLIVINSGEKLVECNGKNIFQNQRIFLQRTNKKLKNIK